MELLDKNYTCCFTGHRTIAPEHAQKLPAVLENAVRFAISDGYFIFICGGALGFDTLAAETVLSLKEEFSQIRLVIAAPYEGQADRWSANNRMHYERIRNACDDYRSLSSLYTTRCMKNRNLYMVQQSGGCIAYCLHGRSGTSQTVNMARQNGLQVIDLLSML